MQIMIIYILLGFNIKMNMIGYKVKWNDSAINDFNEEDKLLQKKSYIYYY